MHVVGHFWDIGKICNERSGERGRVAQPRVTLLPNGNYQIEPPVNVTEEAAFAAVCAYGDHWHDGFASMRNLFSQLESLKRVTAAAASMEPACVVFARPDLIYHDSLEPALAIAARIGGNRVFLPDWQPHHGLNDRFAICVGERAIRAYGERKDLALSFCSNGGRPLHSERLLRFALRQANIPVTRIRSRASRVRLSGVCKAEDFSYRGWRPALRELAGQVRNTLGLGR